MTPEQQINAVRRNAYSIKKMENPCQAACILAIQENYRLFQDLPAVSREPEPVQIAAVSRYPWFITLIPDPSEKVQIFAVQASARTLKWICQPSEAVQLAAVTAFPEAIEWIRYPSEQVTAAANRINRA